MKWTAVVLIILASLTAGTGFAGARADASAVAMIEVDVSVPTATGGTYAATRQAESTANVHIRIDSLRVSAAIAPADALPPIEVSGDLDNPTRADIVISIPGYGEFTYRQLPLWPGTTHYLTPTLREEPQIDDFSGPPGSPQRSEPPAQPRAAVAGAGSCSGYSLNNTPPNSIRVYHSGPYSPDYRIHVVDFNSYVKHVLPREWIASWPAQSLYAGGVAVKMYAWYWTTRWRGGSVDGACYDVDSSTNYQVWDPNYANSATNAAVDAVWDYYLMYATSGNVYETRYQAGHTSDTCGRLLSSPAPGNQMSQWGSKACADAGKVWYDILLNRYYFSPASVLKNGPVATAPGETSLPPLLPWLNPHSNTQVRISWSSGEDIAYFLAIDPSFNGAFTSGSFLGYGAGQTLQNIPTSDRGTNYYRLLACRSGYCSAVRAGGVQFRAVYGNWFYTTVDYVWLFAQAWVATRNTSLYASTMKLYDGVPGLGGTLQATCAGVPPNGGECGPTHWFPASASRSYAAASQQIGSTVGTAIRLLPQGNGE